MVGTSHDSVLLEQTQVCVVFTASR